jgi:hypothetical protein
MGPADDVITVQWSMASHVFVSSSDSRMPAADIDCWPPATSGAATAEVVALALGAVGVYGPAHEAAVVAAPNTTRIAPDFIR